MILTQSQFSLMDSVVILAIQKLSGDNLRIHVWILRLSMAILGLRGLRDASASKNTYFTDKSLSESKFPSVGQRMEFLSLPVLISCCGFPQSVGRHSPLLFCWNLETRIFDRLGGFSVKIAFCLIVEFWAFDKKHV